MVSKALLVAGLAGVFCMPTWAQNNPRYELGIKGGVGADKQGHIGVEVCAYCEGSYALFGEYTHGFAPPSMLTSYRFAELFGAGLRIQGLWPLLFNTGFFDFGFALEHGRGLAKGHTTKTTGGVVLGVGVMIPAGEHLYVRPQLRFYAMAEPNVAVDQGARAGSAEVAIGWRF